MENKAFDQTDEGSVATNTEEKNVRSLSPRAKPETSVAESESELIYKIDDVPPWYMCILLGLQHYLTAFGGNLILPIVVANSAFYLSVNNTLPDVGSDGHRDIWQLRLRQFQGCLMVGSLIQIFIGFSGLMEVFLSFVGPLTIMPTITLIGLALFEVATNYSAGQWYIALLTTALICIFSQYMKNIDVPCFTYKKGGGCTKTSLSLFKMFPVLFAIFISWLLCYILTITDVFPKEKGEWGYAARTDLYSDVLYKSAWFRFPYPGQWGMPSVSTAGVLGIFAGVFASIIESVGDYYACARMAGAPPPPVSAINRGIGIEGITCFLAGAWGAASGNTSYSENIGAIGITKIASRRVIQVGAFVMILLGCLGKFGSLFVTIPQPVIGGIFFVMFGMVAAIGISNLRSVSLDSSRNLFVIGTSLLLGLSLPMWIQQNPGKINTGSTEFDQILTVLLGTNMFVGGFLGLFLDNTLPGTDEERGMSYWKSMREQTSDESQELKIYNLPACFQRQMDKVRCFTFLPFCPGYNSYFSRAIKRICKCCKTNKDAERKYTVNENNGKDLEAIEKKNQLREVTI
ncbi:SLC23A1 [Acanthosepion pharaonis]|uniref:SLC23A1 n=1 Tax=Acanthosepion pharaonis TaxID=158019 RepID=A0A812E4M6_ACAPH|nr:SLC23A1 [Sepia pharaonis]